MASSPPGPSKTCRSPTSLPYLPQCSRGRSTRDYREDDREKPRTERFAVGFAPRFYDPPIPIATLVPVLYEGPFDMARLAERTDGRTSLKADHIREGVVVRPQEERESDGLGRVVLKSVLRRLPDPPRPQGVHPSTNTRSLT